LLQRDIAVAPVGSGKGKALVLASEEDGGTLDALKFSLASDIVELVVLTGDEVFLQTLREAVGSTRRLWHVPTADKVSDLLVAGEVGILVLDVTAMNESASVFVGQIKRQFPDLVVVVAGNRDAEVALAALISAGIVYRFIHKPMSPNRARLFAEAAVRRYGEQRRRAAAETPVHGLPSTNTRWLLGAGAALLLLVVGIVTWRNFQGAAPVPVADQSHAVDDSPLLAQAAAALSANRLTAPAGDNALELYQAASVRSPADPKARAGLAEVRERLLATAENALLEERLDEAAAAIETARQSGVESGRIAFLTAQLAKSRELVKSSQAAIRSREAKAPVAPDKAATIDRITPLLNLAAERIDDGQLLEPERDSARYYIGEALRLDPSNAPAADARARLGARLLAEARSAMDRRDFTRAQEWLQNADGIAARANIETSQSLLAVARTQAQSDANAQLLRNAVERLRQDRLIEPADDSAKYYLLTLRGLDPADAGLAPALQELGTRLIAKAGLALTLKQYSAARSWLDEAAGIGFTSPEGDSVAHELDAVLAKQQFMDDIVPASQISVLKSVPPQYPAKAQLARIEGWVELDFTITATGEVRDISVHGSSPPGRFEQAAIRAVAQWRYQPVLRDAQPTSVRARLRIRFTLP
jgi:TonB family protein